MRRRDFVFGSAGAVAGSMAQAVWAQVPPCPPVLAIDGQPEGVDACGPSALSEAAKAILPGQSDSFDDPGLSGDALFTIQWMNRFHVDLGNGRAHLIGKKASSQGGHRSNCVYDVSTNQWRYAVYDADEFGHIYESIAYDPEAGEIFTGQWGGGDTLKSWIYADGKSLEAWQNPATSSYGEHLNATTQPTLCWHPNLFGEADGGVLALKQMSSDLGIVVAWRRSDNSWYDLADTLTTDMSNIYRANGAIEYCQAGDYCIATFPPEHGGRTFRIHAGHGGAIGHIERIDDVPVSCSYYSGSNRKGILLDDPSGGVSLYILEKSGDNRVWKADGDGWALQPYKHPLAVSGRSWAVSTCRSLGVFWSKYNSEATPSKLWRPAS